MGGGRVRFSWRSSREDLSRSEPGGDGKKVGMGGGTGITLAEFDRARFWGTEEGGTYGAD